MAALDPFVHQPMITCIGNKRKLVGWIRGIVELLRVRCGKDRLVVVDGFAGSTVVSRALLSLTSRLYVNDFERYSAIMAQALQPPPMDQRARITAHLRRMNELAEIGPYREGIITRLYAPRDTQSIQAGERCFYTHENALIIDTLRAYITEEVEPALQVYCLAPLLIQASIHTNTAGVFKGFYKGRDGVGCFGGAARNALDRIMGGIRVVEPVWGPMGVEVVPSQMEVGALLRGLAPESVDVIYLDPPYNQHPYGSNYFMLNVIAANEEPQNISQVSGIPAEWNKSAYNTRRGAIDGIRALLRDGLAASQFVIVSYNNEGLIKDEDWTEILAPYAVERHEMRYDTYKGSRNLRGRGNKVMERMFVVSRRITPP
jgi:adenine-specific DNA-methyltransferase